MDQLLLDRLLNRPVRLQPPSPLNTPPVHLNLMLPSLALGGAERCVLDVAQGLGRSGGSGALYVLNKLAQEHEVESDANFPVISLAGLPPAEQMRTVAAQVLSSPTPVVVSHLIRTNQLAHLWKLGIPTIPVIHNSAMGWHEPIANFDHTRVPFIVAVSDDVRTQLLEAGCPRPVTVIRHEIQRWRTAEEHQHDRQQIRQRFDIAPDVTLIGMVGQFKAHKAYVRAVRVLAALKRSRRVKLLIVGGWDHAYGAGRHAHAATLDLARQLQVLDDLVLVGASQEAVRYISAFDIFLNTSVYEGLSIACMEASQLKCPLVLSSVGGQREVFATGPSVFIEDGSDIEAYVQAIESLPAVRSDGPVPAYPVRHLVPQLWSLIADQALPGGQPRAETLFLTSNLNPGGAQRSLVNLLTGLAGRHAAWLCIIDPVLGDGFIESVREAGVGLIGLAGQGGTVEKARDVLSLAHRLGVRNIVFWNVESGVKLLIAKALETQSIRLIEVSPGPMLFAELNATRELQQRIAFTGDAYIRRLNYFVSKYADGFTFEEFGSRPEQCRVIRNGVPAPSSSINTEPRLVRPATVDARFALVSCCRIVPNKLLENLIEMMTILAQRLPRASLTIVGGLDQRHIEYFRKICLMIQERGLQNIHFAGPCSDVFGFLDQFRAFIMMGRHQGCPNASLEAFSMGLPVIANPDGGTGEQVLHNRNGFLVDAEDIGGFAARAIELLTDPTLCTKMGDAGRAHVLQNFALSAMVDAYLELLKNESSTQHLPPP